MQFVQPNTPAVSVVLPTHNRPELLLEAIGSLLRQTRRDWEAIVVDDASSPPAIVPADERIRIVRHDFGKGGAACKNKGVSLARAPVVAFLDDDDLYAPAYLERALGVLERNPDLDVVFMGVSWFGSAAANGQENYDAAMTRALTEAKGATTESGLISFDERLLDALLKSVPMGFQRPVVRRSALGRIGPYRPDCLLWDCDWAIKAALNVRTAHVADGFYLQRAEGQGTSSRGDRQFDHIKSGIDIKQRLVQGAQNGIYPSYLLPRFRAALGKAWFDLAWHHHQQRNRREALGALARSAPMDFNIGTLKLLWRLMQPRLGRQPPD
ncbi:MAG: glycosyltransferase [Candidatus Thermoplasmatota archaeon]|nr:glycosyltransferase [Candidatus Thermoplasmatota archaeon]